MTGQSEHARHGGSQSMIQMVHETAPRRVISAWSTTVAGDNTANLASYISKIDIDNATLHCPSADTDIAADAQTTRRYIVVM
jgi:hypothetical protein